MIKIKIIKNKRVFSKTHTLIWILTQEIQKFIVLKFKFQIGIRISKISEIATMLNHVNFLSKSNEITRNVMILTVTISQFSLRVHAILMVTMSWFFKNVNCYNFIKVLKKQKFYQIGSCHFFHNMLFWIW